MIRRVRKSEEARKVAIRIFNRYVAADFAEKLPESTFYEMGVLPVFALSAENAVDFDLASARRTGWRFICLNEMSDHGAIINVRRSRWRKPKFSGYSVGMKALRHYKLTQQAMEWAQSRSEDYFARVLIIQKAHIELLWLKPAGSIENSRLYVLSKRGIDPASVPRFVSETAIRKLG